MINHKFFLDVNSLYPEKLDVMHMGIPTFKGFAPRKGYKAEWVIDIPWNKTKEVIAWCKEHLGEPGNDRKYHWRATWAVMSDLHRYTDEKPRIFLRREADVTMFMLKWSGNNGE